MTNPSNPFIDDSDTVNHIWTWACCRTLKYFANTRTSMPT